MCCCINLGSFEIYIKSLSSSINKNATNRENETANLNKNKREDATTIHIHVVLILSLHVYHFTEIVELRRWAPLGVCRSSFDFDRNELSWVKVNCDLFCGIALISDNKRNTYALCKHWPLRCPRCPHWCPYCSMAMATVSIAVYSLARPSPNPDTNRWFACTKYSF